MLVHKMQYGSKKPTSCTTGALANVEYNFFFVCVFSTNNFHDYVFGHSFQLVINCKMLLGLLKDERVKSLQISTGMK